MVGKLFVDGQDFTGCIFSTEYVKKNLVVSLNDTPQSLELMEYIKDGELFEQYEVNLHTDDWMVDGAVYIFIHSGKLVIRQIFEDGPNW